MKISIIHPFTPQAAGVVEKSVSTYHSQPHVMAMANLAIQEKYTCVMEYFTPKWFRYSSFKSILKWNFYPVDFKLNGDHKKWKKQRSSSCLKSYKRETPDVTIINMSAHSSPFSYELSKIILENGKKYIAMLGGQHYTDVEWARDYYRKANHILVHTYMQKREMEKMEMFKGLDIRVFPLGVDCNVFTPQNTKNLSPELLYVGRIVDWKRVHLAIEAIYELTQNGFPDAKLKIIGPISSEEYFKKLEDLVEKFNLQDNIFFLGHKEHNELPEFFQKADLFLLPSDKETFGMVMIESMACGTPVAGMNCPGGPADVITNGIDGILSTPEEYAQAIVRYFQDQDLIKQMKTKARETAVIKYSIDETTRVLFESVQSALHS